MTNKFEKEAEDVGLLGFLLSFEELDITFMNEKAKLLEIERLKSAIEAAPETIPDIQFQACFNFLIGSYWIKFTPLFDKIRDTVQLLVREKPDLFVG